MGLLAAVVAAVALVALALGLYNLMPLPGSDGLRLARLMFAAK